MAMPFEAKITAKRLHKFVRYNPSTGQFIRRSDRKEIGHRGYKGHRRIRIDGIVYSATHLAWLYMTFEWPEAPVRHRDGDVTNNRWDNLYQAWSGYRTRSATTRGVFPFRGVTADRDKYRAKVKIDGKYKTLGKYDTPEEASECVEAWWAEHGP